MLIIRKQQMQVFGLALRREFERRMLHHLRSAYPETLSQMADDRLAKDIADGVDRAVEYDITAEDDVCRWLEIACRRGWAFDDAFRDTWVGSVLADASIDGRTKIYKLMAYPWPPSAGGA